MVAERILHSGSFSDYDNNTIDIKFYQRVHINTNPTSFIFESEEFRSVYLDVWSEDGEAEVVSYPSWMYCYQVGFPSEIPGSNYHKRTYGVSAQTNTSDQIREGVIKVKLQGSDWAEVEIPVKQYAHSIVIHATPSSFTFEPQEFRSVYMEVWSYDGEAIVKSFPDWMYCSQVGIPTEMSGSNYHSRTYAISAQTNTGAARDGVIKIGIQDNESAELNVSIHQNAANNE